MADCFVAGITEERESVVLQLRTLAAELDEIDREIAERAWRRERRSIKLSTEHDRLTARLRRLAERLRVLDEQPATY